MGWIAIDQKAEVRQKRSNEVHFKARKRRIRVAVVIFAMALLPLRIRRPNAMPGQQIPSLRRPVPHGKSPRFQSQDVWDLSAVQGPALCEPGSSIELTLHYETGRFDLAQCRAAHPCILKIRPQLGARPAGAGRDATPGGQNDVIEVLRQEHRNIESLLRVLEPGAECV